MLFHGLWVLVSFHMAVVLGNLAAAFILPFYAPWYISLPIMAFIFNLTFAPIQCPLTKLENRIRRSLGMKEIRHFMGHYLVWPVKRRLRENARTVRASQLELLELGIITDCRGGLWSINCPDCDKPTMEVIKRGEIQCSECVFPKELS